jgi:hypothetical protein
LGRIFRVAEKDATSDDIIANFDGDEKKRVTTLASVSVAGYKFPLRLIAKGLTTDARTRSFAIAPIPQASRTTSVLDIGIQGLQSL